MFLVGGPSGFAFLVVPLVPSGFAFLAVLSGSLLADSHSLTAGEGARKRLPNRCMVESIVPVVLLRSRSAFGRDGCG